MSFGSNLERIRKEKHISQSTLGSALGLTQQMISTYEKDLSSPNVDILIKIADYFHLSIDTLVGHSVTRNPNSENRILQYFESLSERDKERCLLILKTILEDRNLA